MINFRKLAAGRIDLFPASYLVANHLKKYNKSAFKDLTIYEEKSVTTLNWYIALSIKSIKLVLLYEVNNAINEMVKDGTIQKIKKNHNLE